MYFSFELVDVKCNAVLSSDDSPWGKQDGIRVYFLVFTGSNQKGLLESGRELPEPDLVDNYVFYPGKVTVLRNFPPQNASSWKIDFIDVSEGDNVWAAVIGVNEGLPYVAGGGGGFAGKLGEAGIKTYLQAIQAPVSLDLLDVALDAINNAPECRGVAFAYEVVFSARYLFANYFTQLTNTMTLNAANSTQGLQIISRPKNTSGCGTPGYEVRLRVTLEQQPEVVVEKASAKVGQGIPRLFKPKFTLCADPGRPIEVWPVLFSEEIDLSAKNFYLPTETIWQIEGETINTPSGVLTFTKEASFPADGSKMTKPINIAFSVSTVGGQDRLVLKNDPSDGNYSIRVSLLLKFFDNQPPLLFYDDYITVVGQILDGNQAYWDYLKCLEHFRETVTRYVRHNEWIRPGTPIEQVETLERDLLQLMQIFQGRVNLSQLP